MENMYIKFKNLCSVLFNSYCPYKLFPNEETKCLSFHFIFQTLLFHCVIIFGRLTLYSKFRGMALLIQKHDCLTEKLNLFTVTKIFTLRNFPALSYSSR